MKSILVIGAGYVGLVSAISLAHLGHRVICLDIDINKIEQLQLGNSPIYEPGLELLLETCVQSQALSFTASYDEAFMCKPSAIIVAVDTPMGNNGYCDISRVEAVAQSIGNQINSDCVVIIKSTVPVGTNRKIEAILTTSALEKYKIDVISNPEFLREGAALHDFMHADRVIVGVRSERAEEIMRSIYAPLLNSSPKTKFLAMDPESSELTKYAANSMLAMRISFMNWLSRIADKTGANIDCIREGIGSDRRIGTAFLQAGLGFGGSCFPKDIEALKQIALDLDIGADLIYAIQDINSSQRTHFARTVLEYLETHSKTEPKVVSIWGLSFKPNTDDMREAPSLDIIEYLVKRGISVQLFDPIAMDHAYRTISNQSWYDPNRIIWAKTPLEAVENSDALLLITEWDLFKQIDLKELKTKMRNPSVFDGRNFFSIDEMEYYGFSYFSIGRSKAQEIDPLQDIGGEKEFSYVPIKRKTH